MPVTLGAEVLSRYRRFSLYNSPYPAHDHGCAIDLYPETNVAPSPVTGAVVETRTVRAPPKPYSPDHDHLILLDTGTHVVRVLHVEPAVGPGDSVAAGDPLGEMVRAGFFAPWVDNHLHVGFRARDANPYRAAGSLPVEVDVPIEPLAWDGTGTVVERGETSVVLDAPAHPAPGERFAGIAGGSGVVLDGGLPHYDGGGALGGPVEGPVSLAGARIGVARGRDVVWDDVEVRANGVPVLGISLFVAQDAGFGAKVVDREWTAAVGERVSVTVTRRG